jgi:hypothetical protein
VHSDADSILSKTRLNGSGGLDHLTGNGEALWQLLFLCEPLERGKTASSCADFNFAGARALLVALLDNRQVMEESMSKDRSLRSIRRQSCDYFNADRSRSALLTTDNELKLIAAPAIIGFNRSPKTGYRIPAAIGTPSRL